MANQQHTTRVLVVESRLAEAQLTRDVFAAFQQCGECLLCRNASEVRAYIAGAGIYEDRAMFPLPDAILYTVRNEDALDVDLLAWITSLTGKMPVVALFSDASASDKKTAAELGATILDRPEGPAEFKRLLQSVAKMLCEGSEASVSALPDKRARRHGAD